MDFKKFKRAERNRYLKDLFLSVKSLIVVLVIINSYLLYKIVNDKYYETVCGVVSGVTKEKGCGCNKKNPYNFYVFIKYDKDKISKVKIDKNEYNTYFNTKGVQYCGETTNSGYIWICILFGILLFYMLITMITI